jgi:hypothetical protein
MNVMRSYEKKILRRTFSSYSSWNLAEKFVHLLTKGNNYDIQVQ